MKKILILFIGLFLLSVLSVQASSKTLGLVIEETVVCGIENCHGIDVVCGPNPAEMCPMMYAVGDGCRRFAKCEIINGKCQLKPDPFFEQCITCVKKCLQNTSSDSEASFLCESQCLPPAAEM